MKKSTIALIASFAIIAAENSATGESVQPHMPGLVEFMMGVQNHHAKLGLAGSARNWELADYQFEGLKESLKEIAKRLPKYRDVPIGQMIEIATAPPIADIEGAIKARDSAKFTTAFDRLTAACNGCHEAANRGFIVIQRPATSPFLNQSFVPRPE